MVRFIPVHGIHLFYYVEWLPYLIKVNKFAGKHATIIKLAGIARWLNIIPGHHNLQHLQKAVLLGSARILHKVMSSSF